MNTKRAYGDFQTPLPLAQSVLKCLDCIGGLPERVIGPTAGLGSFLLAAYQQWGSSCSYIGYEVNPIYISAANCSLASYGIEVREQNFFAADWASILKSSSTDKVLILGNLPWVTNAALARMRSTNLPEKTNFYGLRGLEAKMGKANFDIAEWMLIHLIKAMPTRAILGILCKTATARRVLRYFWQRDTSIGKASLYKINAKAHFGVAVDACLFCIHPERDNQRRALVYSELQKQQPKTEWGWIDGQIISDVASYRKTREISGSSPYCWRSGVKHDAAKVMEFTSDGGYLRNGLGELLDLEPLYIYPLLKSSDLAKGLQLPKRSVLLTQKAIQDSTDIIAEKAPRTWRYLNRHAETLDRRGSSIYKNRPRFSMFGLGCYSFANWKVALSGLYSSFRFVSVGPCGGKPVMVDDTCYFIPCSEQSEAEFIASLLNSPTSQSFLNTLTFQDAKRRVIKDVLGRISLSALARKEGCQEAMASYLKTHPLSLKEPTQMNLLLG